MRSSFIKCFGGTFSFRKCNVVAYVTQLVSWFLVDRASMRAVNRLVTYATQRHFGGSSSETRKRWEIVYLIDRKI